MAGVRGMVQLSAPDECVTVFLADGVSTLLVFGDGKTIRGNVSQESRRLQEIAAGSLRALAELGISPEDLEDGA